jgi:hypothetical protein
MMLAPVATSYGLVARLPPSRSFTGWPRFLAAMGLVFATIVASFVAGAREPWHRPAFVAAACFFPIYSFSTFGLVGQPWVIGFASLPVALRFTEILGSDL